ncbi:hypothetical protein ACJJTC_008587 [Scirpophaga incertulas]
MNVIVILGFIFAVAYSCILWLLPTLLSWLFKRKYHINLKIGRIAVLKLIFKDVSLSKDKYFVHIDEISFRSSFFNSEINKLVWVVIKGIQITDNVEEKRSAVVETILKPLLSKQNSLSKEGTNEGANADMLGAVVRRTNSVNLLDFRDKKLPHSLIMFAQFMGVHIFNASVIIKNGSSGNGILEVTATEVHADGVAGGPAKALVFSANIVQFTVTILHNNKCLGETSCSLLVEGTVKADGPFNVEKIHTAVSNTTITVQDELYFFITKQKSVKPSYNKNTIHEDHIETIIQRLSPVIPKMFSLKIDATIIRLLDSISKSSFEMSLHSLQVNSRFSAASVIVHSSGAEVVGLPQVYVAFQTDHFRLGANKESLIFVDKLKLDAKLEKGVLNLYLIISTLNLTYDHCQVFEWYTSLRDRRRSHPLPIKKDDCKSGLGWAHWATRLGGGVSAQACAEVRAASVHAALRRGAVLRAGCAGLKAKLDQLFDAKEESWRQWSAELLVDGGWAAPGGRAPPAARRTHAWGRALLAVALVKWGHTPPADSKVEAMMDCLRFEWGKEMAETVISFVDCINAYKSNSTPLPAVRRGRINTVQYFDECGAVSY